MSPSQSFPLITTDLESHFSSLKKNGSAASLPPGAPPASSSNLAGSEKPYEYPAPLGARGAFQGHTQKTANLNISTSQPTFFSPVYTPINWQIPSKRREVYQWCRFFYENEPRVAAALDFYSKFPLSSGFDLECSDRHVRYFFEVLCRELDLLRWLRIISHEIHLLGDCFPFLEVDCPTCHGAGSVNGMVCEHEGGTFKRIVVLNPDFVEVFTNPMSPDNSIALLPDDELKDLVKKGGPGAEKLSAEIRKMVMSGQPIPLDNLSVSHLKYGETGYRRYGVSMIRRLFPILAYKTKLMTAQWIVAERMILPVKVVKVGSEERPASPQDIANMQAQLTSTANDPNLVIVTHHAFDLQWVGAGSQVLQLSQEWEFINQEILDGLGINKSLLNAEGPVYASAAIGAEIMIKRLDSWRDELAQWVERNIFTPISKMRGFTQDNEWGEKEYIVPKIKWRSLNLRNIQEERNMMLSLYDKGLISRRRVLDEFEIDSDTEAEQMRYERIENMTEMGGEGGMEGGLEGAMGGGGAGGLDLGGGMDMGMEMGGDMGMDAGGAMGGGDMGAAAASNEMQGINIKDYGGKVLKEKSRKRLDYSKNQISNERALAPGQKDGNGFERDEDGVIFKTSLEIKVQKGLEERKRAGKIKFPWVMGYKVKHGSKPYSIDIAFPHIKVAVEADGETFHSNDKQVERDKKRDMVLRNLGWTVVRFKEAEIKNQITRVLDKIENEINKKEQSILAYQSKNKEKGKK